jgi:ectoine hydroxylase-related dioxygenase (phytanoyl-CoA dioxygenase family)
MLPRDRFTSIDLPQVQHVPTNRGDVLLFMGASVTHGAFAWEGAEPRRAAIFFFHSARVALPPTAPGAAQPRL